MLDPRTVALAQNDNYAVITTLLSDGTPHSNVMWVDSDEANILMNTEIHRRKFLNIEADSRVTVVIIESGNPYHWVEVRGRVTEIIRGPRARDHIDKLSRKYFKRDYSNTIQSERALLVITPDKEMVYER